MIRLHPLHVVAPAILLCLSAISQAAENSPLKLVFLGDNGHHQPSRRAAELLPVLADRGIEIQYTDDLAGTLNPSRLKQLDGLIVYANIDRISDEQAAALLEYVDQGGGFIPLHCASFCFRNHAEIVALIGAQFQRHGTGTFTVSPTDQGNAHPILDGYKSFESWDETYVHTLHNEAGRTVLEYRQEGDQREPWTWIRSQGKGRVFYTAWGHDSRTFTNPGFHNLVERGIRWACGDDPAKVDEFAGVKSEPLANVKMTTPRTDVAPFEYVDVGPKIPNYVVSQQWGQQEDPKNMMQKPLEPAESIKHYVVPEGFKLQLFASEPEIGGKPIAMTWDSRGRLYVSETYDYPNERQPQGKGRDRIRICEDTDGDQQADKFTIFAEDLSIPTSILVSHGGLIVHQAPDTLFLKDTDGDDIADVRQVLFSGWSTGDTHAGPSNLRYGHDNWIYGMVGYAGFKGQIAGKEQSFRTGFYRFQVAMQGGQLAVTDFEFLRNTNNNSWGVGLSEEGLLFGSTANRNPSEFMPIANRHYERVRGWTSSVLSGIADTHEFAPITNKVRQVDHHGGYTAAAGHAIYTARRYPQEYWNRAAFVAGPTGHLVGTFVLKGKGAGFTSTSPANLLASDDEWAAPIMAEVGPDGNVWVVDWYNYIVQHNPTPAGFKNGPGNAYVTDLRDKKHGRVYRVVYGEQNTEQKPLTNSTTDLVSALTSDNMFWRLHAQRLLVERGDTSVAAKLIALTKRHELDEIGLDAGALHALWTLHGLGVFTDNAKSLQPLAAALKHPSNAVVRAAVTMMPRTTSGRDALLLSGVSNDKDPQIRLATLLALAEMPADDQAASTALSALTKGTNQNDRWMLDAATAAAATNDSDFLRLAAGSDRVTAALIERTKIVAEQMARNEDSESVGKVMGALIAADPQLRDTIVRGWSDGWPKDSNKKLTAVADDKILALFDVLSPGAKGQLIRLAQAWGSQKLTNNAKMIATSLLQIAADEEAAGNDRVQAASQLIGLMDRELDIANDLLAAISPRMPQSTSLGFLDALQGSRAPGIGVALLQAMPRFTPTVQQKTLRVMLARPETTRDLLAAMTARKVMPQDLALDQQQALLAHPNREIQREAREIFSRSGGLPNPDRQKVLASLMNVTEQTGDATRGKAVFTKNCANCHMHQGEGNKVGPDLTGMAVHPKTELLTHILDPSRSVEGNYRTYAVLTLDGLVINGMLASETQTAIEIFDAQGKKKVVLREDIDQLVASTKSVMPEGFEKQIDPAGLTDLLEFLTQKGKFLPLPLDKAATVVSTKGMFHSGDQGADRLVFNDWSAKFVKNIPFLLIDPQGKRVPNIVLLHGPQGSMPPQMPKMVEVPCNTAAKKIHLLSGVSGWGFPAHSGKTISLIVRLNLADGTTEDHALQNGVHFADYIRRVDVPGSEFAMMVRGQQLRLITIEPMTDQKIERIELVKANDPTAPIIVAMTVEIE